MNKIEQKQQKVEVYLFSVSSDSEKPRVPVPVTLPSDFQGDQNSFVKEISKNGLSPPSSAQRSNNSSEHSPRELSQDSSKKSSLQSDNTSSNSPSKDSSSVDSPSSKTTPTKTSPSNTLQSSLKLSIITASQSLSKTSASNSSTGKSALHTHYSSQETFEKTVPTMPSSGSQKSASSQVLSTDDKLQAVISGNSTTNVPAYTDGDEDYDTNFPVEDPNRVYDISMEPYSDDSDAENLDDIMAQQIDMTKKYLEEKKAIVEEEDFEKSSSHIYPPILRKKIDQILQGTIESSDVYSPAYTTSNLYSGSDHSD